MAITNPDGSTYQIGRGVNVVDEDGVSTRPTEIIDMYDQQIIRRSGYPILYYKIFADGDIDPLYGQIIDEMRSTVGFKIFAIFDPERPPQELAVWGIDSPETRVFRVNRKEWYELVKEDPLPGSLIFCKWDRSYWSIIQANHVEYNGWGKYGLEIVAGKSLTSSIDVKTDRTPETGDQADYGHGLPDLAPDANRSIDYKII